MAKDHINNDKQYDVGYKRPPRRSQFQPGKSGNPNGRPRKRESVADVLQKEMNSLVPILNNGKRRKIPMQRAIFKQLLNKAASGDPRAIAVFLNALKLCKPETRDNLGDLLHEFRGLHTQRMESERKAEENAEKRLANRDSK